MEDMGREDYVRQTLVFRVSGVGKEAGLFGRSVRVRAQWEDRAVKRVISLSSEDLEDNLMVALARTRRYST